MKMVKLKKKKNGFAALRERLGYTQGELAKQLDISVSLVKKVEGSIRSLPVSALLKLAALEKALEEKETACGKIFYNP